MMAVARPKNERPTRQLSVRVDAAIVDELNEVAAEMQRVNVGGLGSRVDVLRAAITRGVRVLREELAARDGAVGASGTRKRRSS
jgi:stage III sporulation protein SpoIIIAA